MQQLRTTFDEFLFQRATQFHLLHSFAQHILPRVDPGFRGGSVRLGNQDFVVKLMNIERYIVLGDLRFSREAFISARAISFSRLIFSSVVNGG